MAPRNWTTKLIDNVKYVVDALMLSAYIFRLQGLAVGELVVTQDEPLEGSPTEYLHAVKYDAVGLLVV